MNWPEAIVQWFHILLGTFWFGGVLFANFVVVPAMLKLPAEAQRQFLGHFAAQTERIVPFAAIGTILLGIVRGTVLGEIKDLADFGTTYGIAWLIGLVIACATFAWGMWVLTPRANRLTADMAAAGSAAGGQLPPEMAARMSQLRVIALLELLGFFVVLTTMIVMHAAGEA